MFYQCIENTGKMQCRRNNYNKKARQTFAVRKKSPTFAAKRINKNCLTTKTKSKTMKLLKRFSLLFAAALLPMSMSAQVINGDLNHNDNLDVGDVTLLIDGYLTGETEVINSTVDPFVVDNSRIAGTWYQTKSNYTTYNADGTFGNLGMEGYTYKFLPFQGRILVFDPDGHMQDASVLYLTDEVMYLRFSTMSGNDYNVYYRTAPSQPVTEIRIAGQIPTLSLGEEITLTAEVYPQDADSPVVVWTSSDESVVTVADGVVTAVGEGTATITCTALDGFGATATCTVTVTSASPAPTYEAVDLGLSVKWATMNIGANAPEDYGDYFAWGETTAKTDYSWSTYKWCQGTYKTLTKYNTSSDYSYSAPDNKTQLELADDAAYVNWGGTWRMPTDAELTELRTKCTWTWTSLNGVNGMKVAGPSGNSIFLPAAGSRYGASLNGAGSYGNYWSSSLGESSPSDAWDVYFNSSGAYRSYNDRYRGRSVRAVCP